jgi:hypothetical protein
MIRIRTLIASAFLTCPLLALSAAAPIAGASPSHEAAATTAPPGCIVFHGVLYCY